MAEDHPRTTATELAADFVSAEPITRVKTDPDDIASRRRVQIDRLERFVDDLWVAPAAASRGATTYNQRGVITDAEGLCAWIDEMDSRQVSTPRRRNRFSRRTHR